MSDRYAVIGNPIEHSKSPQIHAAFAAQTDQDLEYGRLFGTPGRFAEEVRRFFVDGGKGLNVTVPFKEQAWRLCDEFMPDLADVENRVLGRHLAAFADQLSLDEALSLAAPTAAEGDALSPSATWGSASSVVSSGTI